MAAESNRQPGISSVYYRREQSSVGEDGRLCCAIRECIKTGWERMRFKRINVDTVRCIVSETELIENGLQMDDFLQNDGKTEEFLRKIVSMAEEEVGFKVQGGPLSVQVAVLPEHLLALTFSERPDSNILNILQNLKSAVDSLSGMGNRIGENAEEEQEEQDPDTLVEGCDKRLYILEFKDMDQIISYAKSIVLEEPVVSSVYRIREHKMSSYYLLIERNGLGDKEICRVISASVEFMKQASSDMHKAAYLAEHGTCVLQKDALEVLQKL